MIQRILQRILLVAVAALLAAPVSLRGAEVTVGKVVYKLNSTAMTARASRVTGEKKDLKSVTIPSTVKYKDKEYSVIAIGSSCFSFTSLTSVTVPEGVETIADGAFSSIETLKSVKLPSSLRTIGSTAFAWSSLEKITIPEAVTSIGEMAFYNCTSLTKVVFKKSDVKSIGKEAFCNCHVLSYIEMPSTLGSIGENAFSNCHALTSITFPDGLRTIPFACCWNCGNLQSVRLPNTVEFVDELAFPCPKLTQVNIPTSLKTTGKDAFIGVPFKKLEFPWGMQTIGEGSFANNAMLEDVTIPYTVTSIGKYAFNICPNIKAVNVSRETPPTLGVDGFGDSYDTAYLFTGYFNLDPYRNAPEWKRFRNIYETSSVAMTDADRGLALTAHPGILSVSAPENTAVEVYTISGSRVASFVCGGATTEVTLPTGIYIVCSAEKTVKVAVP